jgi:hypothetical protein
MAQLYNIIVSIAIEYKCTILKEFTLKKYFGKIKWNKIICITICLFKKIRLINITITY